MFKGEMEPGKKTSVVFWMLERREEEEKKNYAFLRKEIESPEAGFYFALLFLFLKMAHW